MIQRQATGPHAADAERDLEPSGQLPTAYGPQTPISDDLGQNVLVEREGGAPSTAPCRVGVALTRPRLGLDFPAAETRLADERA